MRKLLIIALSVMIYTGAQAQLGSYYSGKSHYKSKGLNWGVKTPLSFTSKQADRPNIVRKWVKGTGKNLVSFMVIVKKLPSEIQGFTKNDWRQYYKYDGGVQDQVAELRAGGFNIPVSKYAVLDNSSGLYYEANSVYERLDISVEVNMAAYQVIVGNHMFSLQLATGSKYLLNKYKPLLRSMANTVIFYDQYGN